MTRPMTRSQNLRLEDYAFGALFMTALSLSLSYTLLAASWMALDRRGHFATPRR